jgi:hypothetical protein
MADIAHTIPTSVAYLDGASFGYERPGLQVVAYPAAPHRSRDWLGYNLRAYDLKPALMAFTDDTLEEWEAFWHHIDGGGAVGYIVEGISGTHRNLVCGGLGDGSKTTFPIPVIAPTDGLIFRGDGRPRPTQDYHTAANILTDDKYADPQTIGDFQITQKTSAEISGGTALVGLNSILVDPDASTTALTVMPQPASAGACVVGDTYTAIVAVNDTLATPREFRVGLFWWDVVPSMLSVDWSGDIAATLGEWTIYSVTDVAPATSVYVSSIFRYPDNDNGAEFYVDAFGVAYGDYNRWHLPSVSPGLVEFVSAPTAGARITATATGRRVTRCRFEPGTSWNLSSAGNSAVRSIRAIEDIEV